MPFKKTGISGTITVELTPLQAAFVHECLVASELDCDHGLRQSIYRAFDDIGTDICSLPDGPHNIPAIESRVKKFLNVQGD